MQHYSSSYPWRPFINYFYCITDIDDARVISQGSDREFSNPDFETCWHKKLLIKIRS